MMQSINEPTAWNTLFELTHDVHGEFWSKELTSKTDPEYSLRLEAGLAVSLGRLIHITEFTRAFSLEDLVETEMVILMVHRLDKHGVIYASFYPASLRDHHLDYPRQSLTFSMGDSYEKRDICGWVPSLQKYQNRFCCKWMMSIQSRYAIKLDR